MRLLNGRGSGLEPIGKAVAGTLKEIELGHRWIARYSFHRELERLFHQSVNDQPVLGGINVGSAVVVTLEKQSVRCDDAMLMLQRRHAPVGKVLPILQHVGSTPAHVRFVLRRHAVIVGGNRLAKGLTAFGDRQRGCVRVGYRSLTRRLPACPFAAGNCDGLCHRVVSDLCGRC